MKRPRTTRRILLALGLATAFLVACSGSAAAAPIPHGTVDLLAENRSIEPGKTTYIGLRFQLENGWHIYWVNPGDSGERPKVTWQLPPGITASAIQWPTPHRLGNSSVVDFGYDGDVMLLVPLRATASVPAQQVQISGDVSVLICRELCIPGKASVSLSLPVSSQAPAKNAQAEALFARARKAQPKPTPAGWKFSASDAKDSFVLTGNVGRQVAQATFFPLDESQIDNAAQQHVTPAANGFRMTLRKSAQLVKNIERLRGVVVLGEAESYIIDAPVSRAGAKIQPSNPGFQPDKPFEEEKLQ